MRLIEVLRVIIMLLMTTAAGQDHAGLEHRGAAVMGFDQNRTTHHFSLFKDGGAIDVVVKDPSDTNNRDAIRTHLRHIAAMFGDGDFDAPMLVHDSKNVPGTAVMASQKNRIRYDYVEVPNGGRVNIVTTEKDAIEAVHQFLKYQITEHKTGDSTDIRSR